MALTRSEIFKIVNLYIGVNSGYLGDFSYRTHEEFYIEYCDLGDVNPNEIEGTTRTRFMHILSSAEPRNQAKILRGILERFPIAGIEAPSTRTEDLKNYIVQIIARLEATSPVKSPNLEITSEVVEIAIADCEKLLETRGAISGVDRVHTALHGYLMALCDKEGILYESEASINKLLKLLRQGHPKLQISGPRYGDIERILNASSTILDALNPVRNRSSVAHPNKDLLGWVVVTPYAVSRFVASLV